MKTIADFSGILDKDGRFVSVDPATTILDLIACSERARREGILALESDVASLPTEYERWLFRLVLDGVDPGIVSEHAANVRKLLLETLANIHETILFIAFASDTANRDERVAYHMAAKGLPESFRSVLTDMEDFVAKPGPGAASSAVPKGLDSYVGIMASAVPADEKRALVERLLDTWHRRAGTYYDLVARGMKGIQSGDNPYILTDGLFSLVDIDTISAVRSRLEK